MANEKENNPQNNLLRAMERLDVEGVKVALAAGGDPNKPLHKNRGNEPVFDYFLAHLTHGMGHEMMMMDEDRRYRGAGSKEESPTKKLVAVLKVLKEEGNLDVNATTETHGPRTLLMHAMEGFGTSIGDTVIKFLLDNGADIKASIVQPVTRWDQEQKKNVPTGETRKADVMTSLLGGHGLRDINANFGRSTHGEKHSHKAVSRAKFIGWMIENGAPLDGEMERSGRTVMEELLKQPYPVGSISAVINPLLKRFDDIKSIPQHDRLLHAVLSQKIGAANYVEEDDGVGTTSTIQYYEESVRNNLVKLAEKLIERGADVNAEVEFKSHKYNQETKQYEDVVERLTPIETAMRHGNAGDMRYLSVGIPVASSYSLVQLLLDKGAIIPDRMVDTEYATSDIKIAFANQQLAAGATDATKLLEREVQKSDAKPNETYIKYLIEKGAQASNTESRRADGNDWTDSLGDRTGRKKG